MYKRNVSYKSALNKSVRLFALVRSLARSIDRLLAGAVGSVGISLLVSRVAVRRVTLLGAERNSLSGVFVVLPLIIIQARFSRDDRCGHSVLGVLRREFLKGGHNARPGTVAFYWLIGN